MSVPAHTQQDQHLDLIKYNSNYGDGDHYEFYTNQRAGDIGTSVTGGEEFQPNLTTYFDSIAKLS